MIKEHSFTIFKILIIIGVLFFIFNSDVCKENERNLRRKLPLVQFEGIVKSKFFDSKNRNTRTILLSDNKQYSVYSKVFYDTLNVGDRVVKYLGTVSYGLYRKNVVKYYYPECCGNYILNDDSLIKIEGYK